MLLENGPGVRVDRGRAIHQQIVTCRIKIVALVQQSQVLKRFVFRAVNYLLIIIKSFFTIKIKIFIELKYL